MRNKSFAYLLWGLSGLLLLVSATLLTARPSGAADTTLHCYDQGMPYSCQSKKQQIEVTFKASFVEPSCEVTVPTQITLPDATISDFSAAPLNLSPDNSGGASDFYTDFIITLQECAADSAVWPKLKLVFTDLGTTTAATGIFAADEPSRDDVGFVIFSSDSDTVDNVLISPPKFNNPGTAAEGTTYHFKARMQVYPDVTNITPGPVVGSVSVVANYE